MNGRGRIKCRSIWLCCSSSSHRPHACIGRGGLVLPTYKYLHGYIPILRPKTAYTCKLLYSSSSSLILFSALMHQYCHKNYSNIIITNITILWKYSILYTQLTKWYNMYIILRLKKKKCNTIKIRYRRRLDTLFRLDEYHSNNRLKYRLILLW